MMNHSNNLDKQIQETKKTSEELKRQLQNLVELRNCSKTTNIQEKVGVSQRGQTDQSNNAANPKYNSKSNIAKGKNEHTSNEKLSSPKKLRNYDVHEAREYIKKQREKRSKESKPDVAKIKEAIREKNLRELHERAQELVSKNVQISRQRSKSREKQEYIRIDNCKQLRNRSLSREKHRTNVKLKSNSTAPSVLVREKKDSVRNPNLLYPPSPVFGKQKVDESCSQELNLPKYTENKLSCVCTNLLKKDNLENNIKNEPYFVSQKDERGNINILSNITIRSPGNLPNAQKQEETNKNDIPNHASVEKQVPIQENQSDFNINKEYPPWLQETGYLGDPLNFINTVKRKLQYAVSSPKTGIDVGVQSSFLDNNKQHLFVPDSQYQRNYGIHSQNQIDEQSHVKSFNSHQHPNLDVNPIKQLELVSKSNQKIEAIDQHINGIEKRQAGNILKIPCEESESDTSKNIPDISSESGTSLKRNAESVRRKLNREFDLCIDTEKINKIRLVPQIKSTTTTIRSEIPKTFSNVDNGKSSKTKNKMETITSYISENVYDTDFESDNIDSSPCSNRSRNSIISYNSPNYNEQKVIIPFPEEKQFSIGTTAISQGSSQSSNGIPKTTSTPNEELPLNTEESLKNGEVIKNTSFQQKMQKQSSNIPEIVLPQNIKHSKTESMKSNVSYIPSSIHEMTHESQSSHKDSSQTNLNWQTINSKRGTGKLFMEIPNEILPLDEPKASLSNNNIVNTSYNNSKDKQEKKLLRNISVISRNLNHNELGKTNEIHLKFEAEIHLLNDFNQSLRQFSAVEKVVESLKSKNELTTSNILHHKDTQTSPASKTSSAKTKSTTRIGEIGSVNPNKSKSEVSSINYSRGFQDKSFDNDICGKWLMEFETSISQLSAGWDVSHSNSNGSFLENSQNLANFENQSTNPYTGLSLNMFDQMIKEEDVRLEHLKTILEIRGKALLDRVRAELVLLDFQKKNYQETGNLEELAVIKKKQRGILFNLEKEKHEMKRVKQMQLATSVERKTALKEQRNLIRKQLSTNSMLGKMKVNTPRKRSTSGPLKVIQNHTESIMSETSVSRKSSTEREEIYSITSHHSVSKVSEISETDIALPKTSRSEIESLKTQQNIKRTLLMREAALRKRRKEAEELLQWNQKLLEEEKRINELELKANSIIRQQHKTTTEPNEKYIFNGRELNQLWYNLTGCDENKFINEKGYRMSQIALERFCESARGYSVKTNKLLSKSSNSEYSVAIISVSENVPKLKTVASSSVPSETDQQNYQSQERCVSNLSVRDYTSDFEVDTTDNIVDVEDIDVNENIDELIHNFSKIEDDISFLSSKHSHVGLARERRKSDSPKSNKTDSDAEISVIETNRLPKETTPSLLFKTKSENLKNVNLDEIKNFFNGGPSNCDEDKKHNSSAISSEKSSKKDVNCNTDKKRSSNKLQNTEKVSVAIETLDNLNKSKEILLILGETETSISRKGSRNIPGLFDEQSTAENINTSEEILSTLNQTVDLVTGDIFSEDSALNLSVNAVPTKDISFLESILTERNKDLNTSENILTSVPDQVERTNLFLDERCSLVNSSEEFSRKDVSANKSENTVAKLKIEDSPISITSEDLCGVNEEVISNVTGEKSVDDLPNGSCKETDIDEELSSDGAKETDENHAGFSNTNGESNHPDAELSKSAIIQKSNSKTDLIVNGYSSNLTQRGEFVEDVSTNQSTTISDHLEEIKLQSEKDSLTLINSELQQPELRSQSLKNGSSSRCKETIAQQISIASPSSIVNETEEYFQNKLENSSKSSSAIQTDSNEVQNEFDSPNKSDNEKFNGTPSSRSSISETKSFKEEMPVSRDADKSRSSCESSPHNGGINVTKRVSEIMTDANHISKGDKSPRLQDFYTTTYGLVSPTISPELGSPVDEQFKIAALSSIFGNEAEEILKKQLAIEQEIKQITEQQQKEQLPFMFVREIPNKPPPPYTPPSSLSSTINSVAVIPSLEEIDEITKYSAKILHKAYLLNNLDNISVSDNTLSLISKDIPKEKYKFVFDLCKDFSKDHYKQFEVEKCPTWMQVSKKAQLLITKPFNVNELEKYMSKKLREVLGYEKPHKRENSIIKWSRKKLDPVDEILVVECQSEEDQWNNYERDELLVINQITNDIMDSLLKETADVVSQILSKRLQ